MDQEELQEKMEEVMDHYQRPKSFGELDTYTFSWRQKNPSCGDTFTIFVQLDEAGRKVRDVAFSGEGCAISTASMSMLCEHLKGKSLQEVEALSQDDTLHLLGIPISPGRMNCALISYQALQGGLRQYRQG